MFLLSRKLFYKNKVRKSFIFQKKKIFFEIKRGGGFHINIFFDIIMEKYFCHSFDEEEGVWIDLLLGVLNF